MTEECLCLSCPDVPGLPCPCLEDEPIDYEVANLDWHLGIGPKEDA